MPTPDFPTPEDIGFSRIAQRNFILASVVALLSAVTFFTNMLIKQSVACQNERHILELEHVKCLQDSNKTIERLKDDQISLMRSYNALLNRERELREALKKKQKHNNKNSR